MFGRMMRGAVAAMQRECPGKELVCHGRYGGGNNPKVRDTWLGQLWQWMSESKLQLRLDGHTACVEKGEPLLTELAGLGPVQRALVRDGGGAHGVYRRSDLLARDGSRLRREARKDRDWADDEWMKTARSALGWHGDTVDMVPMPVPRVGVGDCVAYRLNGAPAVGVVTAADREANVMEVVLAVDARRRTRHGQGAGVGVRYAVAPASRDGAARAVRKLIPAADDWEGAWRLLDTADEDQERTVRAAWVRGSDWVSPGTMQLASAPLVFLVTSDDRHVRLRSRVLRPTRYEVSAQLPDGDVGRLRAELEGIGYGGGGFKQQRELYEQLASTAVADERTLYGFSDGSVSPDGNAGGYGWLVATRNSKGELTVLVCGGGAAVASGNLNTIITSTRMEALGVAAGLSFARGWPGNVEWRLDNTSVITQYCTMRRWAANDWTKVNDRDVFGYIDCLRRSGEVLGRWRMLHQRGHVEKRKKSRRSWTDWEWGNVQSDRVAGNARRAAQRAQVAWDEAMDKWGREQDEVHRASEGKRMVPKPQVAAAQAVEAHALASLRPWELAWEGLTLVGAVTGRVREIKQNTYSISYLRKQTASLFYPSRPSAVTASEGDEFELDGVRYVVAQVDDGVAWYREAETAVDEGLWERMSVADATALVRGDEIEEDAEAPAFSPDPDVRLIRNIWSRKGAHGRVRAVKYMWGLFACNDLMHRRALTALGSSCSGSLGRELTPRCRA